MPGRGDAERQPRIRGRRDGIEDCGQRLVAIGDAGNRTGGVRDHIEQEDDHRRRHQFGSEPVPPLLEEEGAGKGTVRSKRLAHRLDNRTCDDANAQRLDATGGRRRRPANRHGQDNDEEGARSHGEEDLAALERREAQIERAGQHLEQSAAQDRPRRGEIRTRQGEGHESGKEGHPDEYRSYLDVLEEVAKHALPDIAVKDEVDAAKRREDEAR